MRYKVTKQFAQATELPCAQFKEPIDARFFIEKKMADDIAMKIVAIYRLYEFDDLLTEYNPAKSGASTEQTATSQGKSSSSTFNPTPFNAVPRPAGMPQKWGKNEDEEKK